jgi:hypothetical protein
VGLLVFRRLRAPLGWVGGADDSVATLHPPGHFGHGLPAFLCTAGVIVGGSLPYFQVARKNFFIFCTLTERRN